jgi:hypothetical protein
MGNPNWIHEPECGEFEYQRTYLDGQCLTCLLIIRVRQDERRKANLAWKKFRKGESHE